MNLKTENKRKELKINKLIYKCKKVQKINQKLNFNYFYICTNPTEMKMFETKLYQNLLLHFSYF